MKKKIALIAAILVIIVSGLFLLKKALYTRRKLSFTIDTTYYWTKQQIQTGCWTYEDSPSGFQYNLYIPEKYQNDRDNESAKLPLIVTFHGSDERGASYSKYGRMFVRESFQKAIYPGGAAVLALRSRINYFTDTHSTSLLIQNVCLKNKCIDPTNIIGYGFSQGAKFVVQLACDEPGLFRGVVSGSGFHQMTFSELIKTLPIQFYWATSEDDSGIFEQGSPTGKKVGKFCKNSRYVEYKTRRHFFVELQDKTGRIKKDGTEETFVDWMCSVVNEK